MQCLTAEKGGAEYAETKLFSKPKQFWYQNIRHVLFKKVHTHTWCFCSQNKKVMGVWSSEVKCIK